MDFPIPDPDLRGLAQGETIVAFTTAELEEGTEVTLRGTGPRPVEEMKPAYRRWAGAAAPEGTWTAHVAGVVPVARFDPGALNARHILAAAEGSTVAVLRVSGPAGPILTDEAYAARLRSLESALAQ